MPVKINEEFKKSFPYLWDFFTYPELAFNMDFLKFLQNSNYFSFIELKTKLREDHQQNVSQIGKYNSKFFFGDGKQINIYNFKNLDLDSIKQELYLDFNNTFSLDAENIVDFFIYSNDFYAISIDKYYNAKASKQIFKISKFKISVDDNISDKVSSATFEIPINSLTSLSFAMDLSDGDLPLISFSSDLCYGIIDFSKINDNISILIKLDNIIKSQNFSVLPYPFEKELTNGILLIDYQNTIFYKASIKHGKIHKYEKHPELNKMFHGEKITRAFIVSNKDIILNNKLFYTKSQFEDILYIQTEVSTFSIIINRNDFNRNYFNEIEIQNNYYKDLDYNIRLIKKDGEFFLFNRINMIKFKSHMSEWSEDDYLS